MSPMPSGKLTTFEHCKRDCLLPYSPSCFVDEFVAPLPSKSSAVPSQSVSASTPQDTLLQAFRYHQSKAQYRAGQIPIGEPRSMAALAIGMITQLGISGTN